MHILCIANNNAYPMHCQCYKRRCQPIKSEILSLKSVTIELDFLMKAVIIQ